MNTLKEQCSTYIGDSFYHQHNHNLEFTFGEIVAENKIEILNNTMGTVEYEIDQALELIREGVWIRIENN